MSSFFAPRCTPPISRRMPVSSTTNRFSDTTLSGGHGSIRRVRICFQLLVRLEPALRAEGVLERLPAWHRRAAETGGHLDVLRLSASTMSRGEVS